MRLSYHMLRDYKECPKRYNLKHIKKQQTTIEQNDFFTLYGKLVEKFFQLFCNIWRFTMPYMPADEIRFKLNKIYDDLLKTSVIDWSGKFVNDDKDGIFEKAFANIYAIMDSHNQNYFLNTKSETTIEVVTVSDVIINGRLDFIHYNVLSKNPIIFDGKGSTEIGKNVHHDQVLFYALLYFLHFNILPEGVGFFYYRFNTYVPVPFDIDILNKFRAQTSLDIKNLLSDQEYKATPSPKTCKYCDYRNVCRECFEDKLTRKRQSTAGLPDADDVIEIGI